MNGGRVCDFCNIKPHCLCNEVIMMIIITHAKESEPKNNGASSTFLVWQAKCLRHGRLVCWESTSEQGHSNKTQRTHVIQYIIIQHCDHDILLFVRQIAESVTNNATMHLAGDFTFVLVKSRLLRETFFAALGPLKIRTHVAYTY